MARRTSPAEIEEPFHVAIVMDGNGRWATARGMARAAGSGPPLAAVSP